jgi:hypothetical protein
MWIDKQALRTRTVRLAHTVSCASVRLAAALLSGAPHRDGARRAGLVSAAALVLGLMGPSCGEPDGEGDKVEFATLSKLVEVTSCRPIETGDTGAYETVDTNVVYYTTLSYYTGTFFDTGSEGGASGAGEDTGGEPADSGIIDDPPEEPAKGLYTRDEKAAVPPPARECVPAERIDEVQDGGCVTGSSAAAGLLLALTLLPRRRRQARRSAE